ncbi:uncharacterized protein LOC144155968 isoform X2 [Haemaphysalis longicornis]
MEERTSRHRCSKGKPNSKNGLIFCPTLPQHVMSALVCERSSRRCRPSTIYQGKKSLSSYRLVSCLVLPINFTRNGRRFGVFTKWPRPKEIQSKQNFLGSSMGVRNPSLAEEVWKTIQEALQSAQKSKPGNSGKQQPPQQGQDKNENSTGGEKPQNNGADEEKGEQAQQQQPKKRKSDGAESQLPAKKKKHRQENGVNQSSAPEEGDAPSEEATEGKQAQQQQPKKRKSDGAKSQLPAKKKKHCQENGVGQGSAPEEGDAPSEKATEGKQAQQQQPKKRKSDGAESQLPAKKKHCQENGIGQGSAPEEDQAAKKPKLQKENKDDAAEEAEDEQESVKKARFKWKKTIKETLLNAENCQMSMNLLKKTVFDKYRNQGGLLSEEDVQTKFDKVLSNQRYFEHKGGKVRYVKS